VRRRVARRPGGEGRGALVARGEVPWWRGARRPGGEGRGALVARCRVARCYSQVRGAVWRRAGWRGAVTAQDEGALPGSAAEFAPVTRGSSAGQTWGQRRVGSGSNARQASRAAPTRGAARIAEHTAGGAGRAVRPLRVRVVSTGAATGGAAGPGSGNEHLVQSLLRGRGLTQRARPPQPPGHAKQRSRKHRGDGARQRPTHAAQRDRQHPGNQKHPTRRGQHQRHPPPPSGRDRSQLVVHPSSIRHARRPERPVGCESRRSERAGGLREPKVRAGRWAARADDPRGQLVAARPATRPLAGSRAASSIPENPPNLGPAEPVSASQAVTAPPSDSRLAGSLVPCASRDLFIPAGSPGEWWRPRPRQARTRRSTP